MEEGGGGGGVKEEPSDRPPACLRTLLNSYVAAVFKQHGWGGTETATSQRGVQRVLRRRCGDPPLIFQLISWDSGEQRSYFPLSHSPHTDTCWWRGRTGGEEREGAKFNQFTS